MHPVERARVDGILVAFDLVEEVVYQSTVSFTGGSRDLHKTAWGDDVKGQSGCQTP